jgi:hypothetical protein
MPDPSKLEKTLNTFVFSVFTRDARGQRKYRQRTFLVTPDGKESVQKQINELTKTIQEAEGREGEDFENEILTVQEFSDQSKQRPPDFSTTVVTSKLGVVLRSPKTGSIFYDDSWQYCPETSADLKRVIAREDPDAQNDSS